MHPGGQGEARRRGTTTPRPRVVRAGLGVAVLPAMLAIGAGASSADAHVASSAAGATARSAATTTTTIPPVSSASSGCIPNPLAPPPGKTLPPKPAGFFPEIGSSSFRIATAGAFRQSSPTVAQVWLTATGLTGATGSSAVASGTESSHARAAATSPSSPPAGTSETTILVFADEDGFVYVVNAATCDLLPGWPRAMAVPSGAPAGTHAVVEGAPTVAFFDGPYGAPTIVVGAGTTWQKSPIGEVEAFSFTGRPLWNFVVHPTPGNNNGVFSTPAVGPVVPGTGDDVVFGSWNYYVYVLDQHGRKLASYYNAETIWSSPALFAPPGQKLDDIFIGLDKSQTTRKNGCIGGYFTELRYGTPPAGADTGASGASGASPGAPTLYVVNQSPCQGSDRPAGGGPLGTVHGQAIWSSPAIAELGGHLVAAVGTSFYDQPFSQATDELYVYPIEAPAPAGHWHPEWMGATDGPVLGSPAIGALSNGNGGSVPAIVDTSWQCDGRRMQTQQGCLSVPHGSPGWSEVTAWQLPPNGASGMLVRLWERAINGPEDLGSPILVPLQGEAAGGGNDVLAGAGGGLYPMAGSDGHLLFSTSLTPSILSVNSSCPLFNTPAVADVAGPGPYAGWHVFETCTIPADPQVASSVPKSGLWAFPLPDTPGGAVPAWPMFHDSPQHTGVAWGSLDSTYVQPGFTGPTGS